VKWKHSLILPHTKMCVCFRARNHLIVINQSFALFPNKTEHQKNIHQRPAARCTSGGKARPGRDPSTRTTSGMLRMRSAHVRYPGPGIPIPNPKEDYARLLTRRSQTVSLGQGEVIGSVISPSPRKVIT